MSWFFLTPFLLLLFLSSCATMIRGTQEPLHLTSEPVGAVARLDTGQSCLTPCSVVVPRKTRATITFEHAGCEQISVLVAPALASWSGVMFGGYPDYNNGAVFNVQPNPVVANLRCNGKTFASVAPFSALVTPDPPATIKQANEPAIYNDTSSADTQFRNAEREFRAGRMSLQEFREIKKTLQGE